MIIGYDGFRIDLGDSAVDQFTHNRAVFVQVFLVNECSPLLRHIKLGDAVIEAGANTGMFTIKASRAVGPEGRVYAIEPNPSNLSFLHRNLELKVLLTAD